MNQLLGDLMAREIFARAVKNCAKCENNFRANRKFKLCAKCTWKFHVIVCSGNLLTDNGLEKLFHVEQKTLAKAKRKSNLKAQQQTKTHMEQQTETSRRPGQGILGTQRVLESGQWYIRGPVMPEVAKAFGLQSAWDRLYLPMGFGFMFMWFNGGYMLLVENGQGKREAFEAGKLCPVRENVSGE